MKKLLAILLAMMLVMVSAVALAETEIPIPDEIPDPETADQQGADDSTETPHFVKKYTTNVNGVIPEEDVTFTIAAAETNPDTTMITLVSADNTTNKVHIDETSETIDVIVPTTYTKPGKYTYTIKELTGSTQGAKYATTNVTVDVYVVYDTSTGAAAGALKVLGTNVYTTIEGNTKKDEIENTYEVGNLTVEKVISGNMADANAIFTFEVEFTTTSSKTVNSAITKSGTGVLKLTENGDAVTSIPKEWTGTKTVYVQVKGGQNVKFENIPANVSYKVKETKITYVDNDGTTKTTTVTRIAEADQVANVNNKAAYTVTGDGENGAGVTGTISKDSDAKVTITNTKKISVPTGITLDFVPYVMIIALAGLALVALKARKKEN